MRTNFVLASGCTILVWLVSGLTLDWFREANDAELGAKECVESVYVGVIRSSGKMYVVCSKGSDRALLIEKR